MMAASTGTGPLQLDWRDLGTAAADGAEVEIAGWMIGPHSARASRFLLAAEPGCCASCIPRDPVTCIEVLARTALPFTGELVRLHGRWHVRRTNPAAWCYRLTEAQPVEPIGWRAVTRRGVLAGPLMCLVAYAPGTEPARAQEPAARAALMRLATVDIHSHAGAINGVRRVAEDAPLRPVAAPMREGGLAVVCLAAVSDSPVHRVMADHRIHPFREPAPGELYAWTQRAFARAHKLADEQDMPIITDAASLAAARADRPSVVIASEGADFLEGRPDRVDEAYARWQLRHLQLVHYRVNELGDIQTEAPVHGGLTDAGAAVVRRCNQLGLVVDVAHGTFDLVKRAAAVTTKPLVLSHTSLSAAPKPRSRLISPDHARAVAGTGGMIGIWPPVSRFPTLQAMAVGIARMVDVVGVDHVGLGTDMMGLTVPSVLGSYADLPRLAVELAGVGFAPAEVGKILGGNYVRVFAALLS
ncbi:MAG TPA: membrane dipeptidase [Acetobacteraceae bacterium]|nr:membrane dipeptidase [Acetobacteraceae bacterium]